MVLGVEPFGFYINNWNVNQPHLSSPQRENDSWKYFTSDPTVTTLSTGRSAIINECKITSGETGGVKESAGRL